MANKLKSDNEEVVKEKKERSKKNTQKVTLKDRFASFRSFFADERTHKIFGLFLLMLSFFMIVAFISNLFTWKEDQAIAGVDSIWKLITTETKVQNWLGKFGALTALKFENQWFGICAFAFPFLFILAAVRIIWEVNLLPVGKTLRYTLFATIWISTFLGYIFHNNSSLLMLAGGYGFRMSQSLNAIIGFIGTGTLLVFSFVGFLVAAFNIPLKRKLEETLAPVSDAITDVVAAEEPIKVNKPKKENLTGVVELELGHEEEFEEDEDGEEEEEEEEDGDFINLDEEEEEVIEEEEEVEEDVLELTPIVSAPTITIGDGDLKLEVLDIPEEAPVIDGSEELPHAQGDYDPTLDLSSYRYPTLDLLESYGDKKVEVNKEELEANKNKIVETLSHYNIGIDKIKATIGPTVTLFEIVPQAGIRISKIKNLEDDIALSLAALGIRIIAPIPGKGTIGIEVPNLKPEIVAMKSILGSEKFVNTDYELPIGFGKTISNEVFVADLTKMPHLLMAGATGQGKSVGLNAILVSLLYRKHPAQVKFVLVDPKKVELTLFKTIERHFLAKLPGEAEAIITDTKKVINTLNSLCMEMDQRYELLKDAQVRNIKEYNAKFIARKLNPTNGHKFLPYIILVVDEFADLIMTAGKEVETPIARLAQLARAIGIHLIIATQRPSVNIITGTIKANFPARIAFRVTSKIDSRTILDTGGADQLIGRGDMLFSTGADLIRLQCAFVDTPEVEKVTDFIGSQRGYSDAHLLPEYHDESGDGSRSDINMDDRDPLFEDAAQLIVQNQQGSASLLQRRLKLGYNRAGRIIDQLEAAKIIGPFEGSKAREVLVKDPISLEHILGSLRSREN
ncbi:MAG: DNA translocase FtsK 4TM domain-containing protein [Bacteroidetes bacterium]|nr:DNA translocase FtsK 4TM domain-containing protein [Bacteroidota bacterium]MBK7572408.1 DNA translocase FtsK 4TM domain-containing protein [Bacteroidota bacterium]MBP9791178.1 DNA translocase FtsK 4TM domain-containing protein [Bacteroidia bacterium]